MYLEEVALLLRRPQQCDGLAEECIGADCCDGRIQLSLGDNSAPQDLSRQCQVLSDLDAAMITCDEPLPMQRENEEWHSKQHPREHVSMD